MLHRAKDWRLLLLAIGLLLTAAPIAFAADAEPAVQPANGCDFQRAGNPECVARYARPSNGPNFTGYYVGGGSAFRGEPRSPNEGTWGWDYAGPFSLRHIDLGWWHGARYQGGTGQYQPDRQRSLLH
jgi:hypothetical protein